MSDHDTTIEARLMDAADQLVESFADLDTEATLRAVRSGLVTVDGPQRHARSPRWLAVAAAVTLLVGGTAAIAISRVMRSERGDDPTSPITVVPPTTQWVLPA